MKRAYVVEIEMPISSDLSGLLCRTLYKVEYEWEVVNGCFAGRTFGIYENEDVAKFVAISIENGSITPF
jgi:hypothetical protein